MTVEPVDVDFAVAVADVDEDRAVGDLRQLPLAQHPVEPRGSDDHARCAEGGGHLGNTAPVVLCLDEPHRVEIDDRHDGAEVAGASSDALAHRPEPDHDDLAPVQRQTRDRREGGPRLDADVVTVVDQVLERDPVPVEHRERDLQSVESVQPGGRRLKRSGRPVAGSSSGGDQVAAHVAQGISRFADEPRCRGCTAPSAPGRRLRPTESRCRSCWPGCVGGRPRCDR